MVSKVTPYRHHRGMTAHEARERLWCGRHRRHYLAWVMEKGKLTVNCCFLCLEEAERAKPVPMGGDHE